MLILANKLPTWRGLAITQLQSVEYGGCNESNLIIDSHTVQYVFTCLLLHGFNQLETLVISDHVLFLYLALPFSLGSMAVTGGLIYNGKALTSIIQYHSYM